LKLKKNLKLQTMLLVWDLVIIRNLQFNIKN